MSRKSNPNKQSAEIHNRTHSTKIPINSVAKTDHKRPSSRKTPPVSAKCAKKTRSISGKIVPLTDIDSGRDSKSQSDQDSITVSRPIRIRKTTKTNVIPHGKKLKNIVLRVQKLLRLQTSNPIKMLIFILMKTI